ncbi:MAG: hypothetical protein KAI40_03455 [Desulfobacterales bacterium]|nr:hypothetical protein [Desulfobacterales bacterium]
MKKLIILIIVFFAVDCFALQALIKVPIDQKLKTDKETTVLAIEKIKPTEIKEKIKLDELQVTDDILWNTRVYKDYKLINVIEDISLEDLQARIDTYKLDWIILAANDGTKIIEVDGEKQVVTNTLIYYDFNVVINFIKRDIVYIDGEVSKETVPTEVILGKFAGQLTFEGSK